MYNENGIWLRNGVSKIEDLKPLSIYDFFEMNSIFENKLGFNTRGCQNKLRDLGYDIPISEDDDNLDYCDYWHYQLNAVFSNEVVNDSVNYIYVGTTDGVDYKRLGTQPNEWKKMMLTMWNILFSHLANEHGRITVFISW